MSEIIAWRSDRPPTGSMRKRKEGEPTDDRREAKRFYSRKSWLTIRRSKLRANPYCEVCLETGTYTDATEVHHKTDRVADQDQAFEWDNLQSICKPCHSRESAGRLLPGRPRANPVEGDREPGEPRSGD